MVRGACPWDRLTLCPVKGCSSWSRMGQAMFGFLRPGDNLLTLERAGRCLCRLRLGLPPGANITVVLDPVERTWSWQRELCHCFFNQPDRSL